METISRSLLTFLLNSLWQVSLAAAVAALACRLMRHSPASYRHAVWVAALAAAILLPLTSIRTAQSTAAEQRDVSARIGAAILADGAGTDAASHQSTGTPRTPASEPASRSISFAQTTATVLLGSYLVFVLFRIVRLGWAWVRTVRIRHTAQPMAVPEPMERVWNRCQEAFGLTGVELLFSAEISGPVEAGRTIILPESLRDEQSEDVLITAIGHEMSHVARRDFACNLLYELLHLPVSFHPAAWLIRSGIERTREMASDDLVTHRLIDAQVYARSIVSIAAGMTALPRPGYTLGVFDGDILEDRIRRLVERPAANLKRARLLLISGLGAMAICAVVASGLAFNAHAQSGADDLINQATAAFQRGDRQAAIGFLENAVILAPANLTAKMSLAEALLQDSVPGTDPANPLVTRANQLFLDVLARDPAHKGAMRGMLNLTTSIKRLAEAHEWAVRLIQADATDKSAYYMAGFLDWAIAYPPYVTARQAAGMRLEDSGIIPDPMLRANFRAQHMAQLEDGMRMLDYAIQLDPDYSDAMAYINLLYRIEAAVADTPGEYADLTQKADEFVGKALAAKKKQAQNPVQVTGMVRVLAPPPPPPPPPPAGNRVIAVPPGAIHVEGREQQARLLQQTPPVYPPESGLAETFGAVRLSVLIGKDGKVQSVKVLSGLPAFATAAVQAVGKWVYQPTLLNGTPVEVVTTVELNFNKQ